MLSRLFIAALWSTAGKRADLLALVGVVYCTEASSIMRVLAERSLIGTYLYS